MNVFLAISKKGGLDFGSDYNTNRFRNYLKEHPNKAFKITEAKRLKTPSQNNLYWLYLDLIERETGNEAALLHEYFKKRFLIPKFATVMGEEVELPRSIKKLTRTEMSDYMTKICAETNVPIPDTEKYKEWRDGSPLIGEEYQG